MGVCEALSFIHQNNLAHRDLKPHNLLLSDDRQSSILTDFGSMTERIIDITNNKKAQEIQDWASENCSMFYRAPELYFPKVGTTITEKADIWSLGCLLYAMMFNKGPFDYVIEKGHFKNINSFFFFKII
jgi:serine/threonine kinase 16